MPSKYSLKIQYKATLKKKEHRMDFIITCKNFAKGVHISSKSQQSFSDNFFDLNSVERKKGRVSLNEKENLEEILNTVKVKSLWDGF